MIVNCEQNTQVPGTSTGTTAGGILPWYWYQYR